jgi:hypothetical protein
MAGQSGDESAKKRTSERLYSEFVKENHMDLGTAIHAISNTYIHTFVCFVAVRCCYLLCFVVVRCCYLICFVVVRCYLLCFVVVRC